MSDEIKQPTDVLTLYTCLYNAGTDRFLIRASVLPFVSTEQFVDFQKENDLYCCEGQDTSALWTFVAVFPHKPDHAFMFTTHSMHAVQQILENPRMIGLYSGEALGELMPKLDPITGDASLSIAEYNDWIDAEANGTSRRDFDTEFDWDSIEKALQDAGEQGEEDND